MKTPNVEILNISKDGIQLNVRKKEYFLSFEDFPWFKDAKVSDIYKVNLIHSRHLHWPGLDVDLDVDSLENLDKYTLRYSSSKNKGKVYRTKAGAMAHLKRLHTPS